MSNNPVNFLRIHESDNAAVALSDLSIGTEINIEANYVVRLSEQIPAKHKFAMRDLSDGDVVIMYGVMIGRAVGHIRSGARITRANLRNAAEPRVVGKKSSYIWTPPDVQKWENTTFNGYHRDNGSVGTANMWLVIPLVFCENRNLMLMKDALLRPLGWDHGTPYEQFVARMIEAHKQGKNIQDVDSVGTPTRIPNERLLPNVDGLRFLSHAMGCGGTDDDTKALLGLLAGYITHPNVAGATVLSLGCQKAQINMLLAEVDKRDPEFSKPLFLFEQQKSKSEKQMMSDAIRSTFGGMIEANNIVRAPAPLSKLVVGMECGGSDGFSGISANPVMGGVSDRLAALKAAIILGEFPELSGIEQSLLERCKTPDLGERFVQLMDAYEAAAKTSGVDFGENPSHGNIADGLITGAMKSAGAARKGGSSPISGVLDYPEIVRNSGLNLLCTPGSDVESTTAMGGAHANLMIFSTGLGTPTGNAVSPVLKISTNSKIATNLPDMIDFDAGPIIRGEATIDELADQLLDLAIETASGNYRTMAQRLGQDDFIPWKRGVSL